MNSSHPIYVANPAAEFLEDRNDLLEIITKTLDKGTYILGEQVEMFEQEFATYLGVHDTIGVANGTDAISYALRALNVLPGDEVVTVSHSAVATVSAIELIGAVPVLADINPLTRCMCPKSLEKRISSRVKAIVVVHIYGHAAQMVEICHIAAQHNIPIVEDCAQAHGATLKGQIVGSIAPIAAFSFYPTKNLGALGDGGAVAVRDNVELAERVRTLRQYGWKERYISTIPGGNSRLDELQAAILRYRLKKLPARNSRRREIASFYNTTFTELSLTTPQLSQEDMHAMHQYVIATPEREALKAHLLKHNVHAALHYPQAIHLQPAYKGRLRGSDELPVTESFYAELLSLPVYPQLQDEQIEQVASSISSFWSN